VRISTFTRWGLVSAILWAIPPAGAQLVQPSEIQNAGLTRYWDAQLGLSKEDRVVGAHLVDDSLYVLTVEGGVFSLDARVGLVRWAERLARRSVRIHRPTHLQTPDASGPAVFLSATGVSVVDRFAGKLLYRFTPSFSPSCVPVGVADGLFVGSTAGSLYALALPSHAEQSPVQVWEARTGAPVTAAPVIYPGGRLLIAASNGKVVSCFFANKQLAWEFCAREGIVADPVVADGAAYIASLDRRLYKLDAESGARLWEHRFEQPLRNAPQVAGSSVFQYRDGAGLAALDATSGELRWEERQGLGVASLTEDRVIVESTEGDLLILARSTGKRLATVGARAAAYVPFHASSDATYLVSEDGRIECLRPAGVPYLRPDGLAEARRGPRIAPRADSESDLSLEAGGGRSLPELEDPLRSQYDRPSTPPSP